MYVWELVSCRLRVDGWHVWHTTRNDNYGPIYTVHLQRSGMACEVSGPTLTEAYAAAAKQARNVLPVASAAPAPHFARNLHGVRA
jgi:hypothetical protein